MTIDRISRAAVAAAAFVILPASAFAQEIGVKGGINVARLTPEEEDEAPLLDSRLAFTGGLWVRLPVSSRVSFQVEGLYSGQGVKMSIPAIEDFPGGKSEIRLGYLQIPLLARGDFGGAGSSTRFYAGGGLAPSFNLTARASVMVEAQDDITRDVGDQVKPFDLGLLAGAGVAFGRVVVEGRYLHGLLHINEDDNGDDRIKNRVFSVTIGVRLR